MEGAVLGIDVGYSATARSTCFCLLEWNAKEVTAQFRLTTASSAERTVALDELVNGRQLRGVAIDGPLASSLTMVSHYRAAEAILSKGVFQKRGKPGQTSAPVGQRLHAHATELALLVIRRCEIDAATHLEPIDSRRVVEAFPNMYLAALLDESQLKPLSRNASDVYWTTAANECRALAQHLELLLPRRAVLADFSTILDHDHRAGMICAITALAVATDKHVAVGDSVGGDIILPPRAAWGRPLAGLGSWMEPLLRKNLGAVRQNKAAHFTHARARIVENGITTW